jgi:hypothetical protein
MSNLLRPDHLFFIFLIVLILFGPGKLTNFAQGLGRMHLSLRGQWGSFRGALFMAKGVDPAVGRDVGDMLEDEEARQGKLWVRVLLAILLGNVLYVASSPLLAPAAALHGEHFSMVPALVDSWCCLLAFGILGLLHPFRHHHDPKPTSGNKPSLK